MNLRVLHGLLGPDARDDESWSIDQSDFWARGILTGKEGPEKDSAVKNLSWAIIKASLND